MVLSFKISQLPNKGQTSSRVAAFLLLLAEQIPQTVTSSVYVWCEDALSWSELVGSKRVENVPHHDSCSRTERRASPVKSFLHIAFRNDGVGLIEISC